MGNEPGRGPVVGAADPDQGGVRAEGEAEHQQGDNTILVNGPNPDKDTYTVTFTTKLTNITGLRLEVLSDPSLPAKGPGRADNGNIVLHEFKVRAAPTDKPMDVKPVPLHKAVATFSQDGFPIANAIDGNPATGWALVPQFGKTHSALFEVKEPVKNEKGTTFTITIDSSSARSTRSASSACRRRGTRSRGWPTASRPSADAAGDPGRQADGRPEGRADADCTGPRTPSTCGWPGRWPSPRRPTSA